MDYHKRDQCNIRDTVSDNKKKNRQGRNCVKADFSDQFYLQLVCKIREKQNSFNERNPMFRMQSDSQVNHSGKYYNNRYFPISISCSDSGNV